MIFSIEVTATYYNIAFLPQALWCAIAAISALELVGLEKLTSIFDPNLTSVSKGFSTVDLGAFLGLGVFCGLLGGAFVKLIATLAAKRNAFLQRRRTEGSELAGKLALVCGGVLLVAPCVYADMRYGLAAAAGDREDVANLLFAKDAMGPASRLKTLVFVPYKLATTAVSVCLPLPAGLFDSAASASLLLPFFFDEDPP